MRHAKIQCQALKNYFFTYVKIIIPYLFFTIKAKRYKCKNKVPSRKYRPNWTDVKFNVYADAFSSAHVYH